MRVGGPGHVYFMDAPGSLYGRDGKEMHETFKGHYAETNIQSGWQSSNGLLIDRAMRLWTLGADKEAMQSAAGVLQEYHEIIH
jgi:hypothetical protein